MRAFSSSSRLRAGAQSKTPPEQVDGMFYLCGCRVYFRTHHHDSLLFTSGRETDGALIAPGSA